MDPVSILLRLVRMYVPSVPDFIAEQWLIEAARWFCRESRYRRSVVFIDTIAGISAYQLVSPNTNEQVIGAYAAEYDGCPLKPSSPEEMPSYSGTPRAFWYAPAREIVVGPTPVMPVAGSLAVRVILQPTVDATMLSREILDRHDSTIAAGAIWRILSMPGKTWTDVNAAETHKSLELEGMEKARITADMEHRHFDFDTLRGTL